MITSVRTGGLDWRVIETELRQPGDLMQLREQIEATEGPASTLLELQMSGLLAAEDRGEISRIQEILSSRFLFGRVDASRVRPSPEDESWIAGLPAGVIREAGSRIQELADPHFAGERPEDSSPEVATRALVELYAMIIEAEE